MNWQEIESMAERSLKSVEGGHTAAKRGLVTLPGGQDVFVKLAVDVKTQGWLEQELQAYHWLEEHQYKYAPRLIAEGLGGFALPDLSTWDWTNSWSKAKVQTVLRAMDALADLSDKASTKMFGTSFGDDPKMLDPWRLVPFESRIYQTIASGELLKQIAAILTDHQARKTYAKLAVAQPWRGNELVHFDVRADNFAYNFATDDGLLVDWNWLCFGSKQLDQTTLLVNVQTSGYDVLAHCPERLDLPSLAWFVGFELASATRVSDDPQVKRLRLRQLESALVAHQLAQKILR